jgi:hypothetical protein
VRGSRIFRAKASSLRSSFCHGSKPFHSELARQSRKGLAVGLRPTLTHIFSGGVGGIGKKRMPPAAPGKMFRGEEAKTQTQGRKTMYGSKNRNFDSNNPRSGISSDDPNALEKLRTKLAELEHFQEFMKKVNIIKKESTTEGRIKALLPLSNNEVS